MPCAGVSLRRRQPLRQARHQLVDHALVREILGDERVDEVLRETEAEAPADRP